MRKYKATWGLLLIFLGLIAYLYFVDLPRDKKEAEKKEKDEKLFNFISSDVDQVEILSSNGHLFIQKNSEGGWTVKNLVPEPKASLPVLADSKEVDTIIGTVHDLKSGRVVDEKGEDLKTFGFGVPEKSVTMTLKDHSSLKLVLGADGALSESVYVKRGDRGTVYLTDAWVKQVFEKDFFALKSKEPKNDNIKKETGPEKSSSSSMQGSH
jgi:hypothetical protein